MSYVAFVTGESPGRSAWPSGWRWAGKRATGSAVVSDLMVLARQIRSGVKNLMPPLAHVKPERGEITIQPIEELRSSYPPRRRQDRIAARCRTV